MCSSDLLNLSFHPQLEALTGLEGLDPNSIQSLRLHSSPQLAGCAVESICQYLENGGEHFIRFNAADCESQTAILDQCRVSSTDDLAEDGDVTLYPNPTTAAFELRGLSPDWRGTIEVINAGGRVLFQAPYQAGTTINSADWPAGCYWVRLRAEGGARQVLRLVKT